MVHLACAPASVAFARRALSDDLKAAGVFDQAVCDAVLVVSELVSNAILHAYPLPGERLKVTWAMDDGWLEVAVSDGGSATMPHTTQPTPSSVGGRGLAIVAHISQTWGVRTDEVGLTVWAILPAPGSNGSGDGHRALDHVEQGRPAQMAAQAGKHHTAESVVQRASEAVARLKATGT